ncbi:MAG: mercuric transport protein MerTP [Flavobacteriales bacterium]|nr:mercuric transport protein MerTP [Flavobacteriales bacterium]
METNTKNKAFLGTGVIAAIASSLCCIGPVIAFLGGISGAASAFSWIEPARIYLMGASALALGLAFWQAYKPIKSDDCGCEIKEKPSFFQSKGFLWGITFFSITMFSFPYYSSIFYGNSIDKNIEISSANLTKGSLYIDGMTCAGCEKHVVLSLMQGNGVSQAEADYENGIASVTFDKSKISIEELGNAVTIETGYAVVKHEIQTSK